MSASKPIPPLPTEIWTAILSLIPSEHHGYMLHTCKEWYEIFTFMRKKREETKWLTPTRCVVSSVPLLKWALKDGLPMNVQSGLITHAAVGGHLTVFQWLYTLPSCSNILWWEKTLGTSIVSAAVAKSGRLDVLDSAKKVGFAFGEDVCKQAATHGNLDMLHWARANGCPWSKWAPALAARAGHLSALQWLRENECPWDSETCAYAAEGGSLSALQWARAKGCPWDEMTCAYAASGGHLALLQWAREHGCKWDARVCAWAARRGHLATLQWAREQGCQWGRTLRGAREGGHHHIVEWALENGCPDV